MFNAWAAWQYKFTCFSTQLSLVTMLMIVHWNVSIFFLFLFFVCNLSSKHVCRTQTVAYSDLQTDRTGCVFSHGGIHAFKLPRQKWARETANCTQKWQLLSERLECPQSKKGFGVFVRSYLPNDGFFNHEVTITKQPHMHTYIIWKNNLG